MCLAGETLDSVLDRLATHTHASLRGTTTGGGEKVYGRFRRPKHALHTVFVKMDAY